MAKNISMSFDISGLDAFVQNWETFEKYGIDEMMEDCCRDITRSMLSKVKQNTGAGRKPTDLPESAEKYWDGYVGGQLRDSWQAQKIRKTGSGWQCGIQNNTEYAIYYEYGHRQNVGQFVPALGKRLKQPFVEGHFPVRKTVKALERQLPAIGRKNIDKHLRRIGGNDK